MLVYGDHGYTGDEGKLGRRWQWGGQEGVWVGNGSMHEADMGIARTESSVHAFS